MLNSGIKGSAEEWRTKLQQINRVLFGKVCEKGAAA